MLQRSASDWNHGALAGFMSDYAKDSITSYMAAGHVMYGWQAMYDRYQANYFAPGKSRDSLSFDELHVRVLTPDFAYATARFKLSRDRKSTRLNSSHQIISYAVFCLKKKKNPGTRLTIEHYESKSFSSTAS